MLLVMEKVHYVKDYYAFKWIQTDEDQLDSDSEHGDLAGNESERKELEGDRGTDGAGERTPQGGAERVVKYLQVTDDDHVVLVPYNYAQFGYFPRVHLPTNTPTPPPPTSSHSDDDASRTSDDDNDDEVLSRLSSKEVFRRLRLDSETVLLQSLHNGKYLSADRYAPAPESTFSLHPPHPVVPVRARHVDREGNVKVTDDESIGPSEKWHIGYCMYRLGQTN
jgi:hypothetical protein